jgi:hypothetical protein
MTAVPLTCAKCRKHVRAHFAVQRVNAQGVQTVAIVVCSVSCLIGWAYTYATMASTMAMGQVRNTLAGLIDAVKGRK